MEDASMSGPGLSGEQGGGSRTVRKAVVLRGVRENDIYVTRKRPLVVYFRRAMDLLTVSEKHNSIYEERLGCRRNKRLHRVGRDGQYVVIHGMGACIMTAVWLVQDLKSNLGDKIQIEVATKTVQVTDEHTNKEREWESSTSTRNVSGISIKVSIKHPE